MTEKPKPKPRTPNLGQLVSGLKRRVEQLERDLRSVKDILNTKNNWNAEIREWIGKPVKAQLRSGGTLSGVLKWVDRYDLCVIDEENPVICSKGGVDTIQRAG